MRGVVTYNTAMQTVTTYQDWRAACPPAALKDQKCQMMEDVLDSKYRLPVAHVAITTEDGKEQLGVTLPLGVALPPGAGLVLGTDPAACFPYRTCDQVGCIAVLDLDDKTQASLVPPRMATSWSPAWTASRWPFRSRSRAIAMPRAPIAAPKQSALPGSGDWLMKLPIFFAGLACCACCLRRPGAELPSPPPPPVVRVPSPTSSRSATGRCAVSR